MVSSQRVIFLDIDGTMVNFNGEILPSTVSALKAARRNGHYLVICSGRSRFQIDPRLLSLGFQGIVGGAGAFVEVEGKEVFHQYMEENHRKELAMFMEENKIAYSMQASNAIIMNAFSKEHSFNRPDNNVSEKVKEQFAKIIGMVEVRTDPWVSPFIEKANYNDAPFTVQEMQEKLGAYFTVVGSSFSEPDDYSGEISVAGVNKASGMEHFLDAVGLRREDSIAFGDGPNDVEMLEYAGIGVAMGNAQKEAKNAADHVTDDIAEDGLARAFEKLGLI